MKKLTLLSLALAMAVVGYTQNRAKISDEWKNFAVRINLPGTGSQKAVNRTQFSSTAYWPPQEAIIGNTWYDLQTNASMQNRVYLYDDGTIGAVWTMGFDHPNFLECGTGYNYFNGSSWGPPPTQRLETDRTGWPTYAPWGENGELVVSHLSGAAEDGLLLLSRENKGVGAWTESLFEVPQNGYYEHLAFPRLATGSIDNSVIHIIAYAIPYPFSWWPRELLYSRSTDGGLTWDPENIVLPGIGAEADYYFISGDTYDIIAKDQYVALLVGGSWNDLVLLKSTDGGDNWEKAVIWQHPYPFFDPQNPYLTDTFYCADGAHHLAFDMDGKVHVVFGINRAVADATATYWFPAVGGIGYWNENRPSFSSNLNSLSPYGDPGSELLEDYNLIGWTQDINNNDTLEIFDEWGWYYLGFSSMPQILIDESNHIYLVFSSVTETYNNGIMNYRHLWCRYSPNGDWWGPFYDLTSETTHTFDECVFPSLASNSDDFLHLVYQLDNEPGMAAKGDQHPYHENAINFIQVLKEDIKVGIDGNDIPYENHTVLYNYPNPMYKRTSIRYFLSADSWVKLKLINGLGQEITTLVDLDQPAGSYEIDFKRGNLDMGIYYCILETINEKGLQKRTNKMVITH